MTLKLTPKQRLALIVFCRYRCEICARMGIDIQSQRSRQVSTPFTGNPGSNPGSGTPRGIQNQQGCGYKSTLLVPPQECGKGGWLCGECYIQDTNIQSHGLKIIKVEKVTDKMLNEALGEPQNQTRQTKQERSFIKIERELGDEKIKDIKEVTFNVYNHKKEYLGWIDFKREWKNHKQFVFNPAEDTFFTNGCLQEIQEELSNLNKKIIRVI